MTEIATKRFRPFAPWSWALHWQIVMALICGVGLGAVLGNVASGGEAPLKERWDYLILKLMADLFMNGLKMLVVPLVMTAIAAAVAGIGRTKGFARLGAKTVGYYLLTSTLSILIGLALVNLVRPGVVEGPPLLNIESVASFTDEVSTISAKTDGRSGKDILNVFRSLIPPNIIQAAAEGSMLGLIVFSLLLGVFAGRIEGPKGQTLRTVIEGAYEVMLGITDLILRFAGPGVFALLACTVAEQWGSFSNQGHAEQLVRAITLFTMTVVAGLAIHVLVVMPILLAVIGRVNPLRHYRAMFPAMLTAFSSASSAATLPLTIDCVERRAGVSNRIGSFVLPLGATVNMDGTALYECVAAMFVAQAFGIDLSFSTQLTVVALALLTSIGVAGIPAASLVAIVIILNAVGLPPEGLAVILVVDRFLDMCRTSVNIFSDSCGAVIIARSEGEGVLGSEPRPTQKAALD
jgi:proton glutamate symport protein